MEMKIKISLLGIFGLVAGYFIYETYEQYEAREAAIITKARLVAEEELAQKGYTIIEAQKRDSAGSTTYIDFILEKVTGDGHKYKVSCTMDSKNNVVTVYAGDKGSDPGPAIQDMGIIAPAP